MEKSPLLQYVLTQAEELAKPHGDRVTPACFVAVLIRLAESAKEEGGLPGELFPETLSAEWQGVYGTLSDRGLLDVTVAERLLATALDPAIPLTKEAYLFRRAEYRAQIEAATEDDAPVGADLYLQKLLENPSAALQTVLQAEDAEEKKEGTGVDILSAIAAFKKTSAMADAAAAKAASPKEEAGAEEEEKEEDRPLPTAPAEEDAQAAGFSVSEAVRRTTEIQRALLAKVVGQDQAVNAFCAGYFQGELAAATQKNRRGPLATYLFAGPPGVGKTFLAESAADALGLPFLRVDMSEYADNDSLVEFCGSDNVYKNGKEGNVTKFLKENPRSVILFDEIEKAHLCIIHLFLQILDSGNIRDNFSDELVSFGDTILIFTTNVGRKLYEDPTATNLAMTPRKKILEALSSEKDPTDGTLMFPTAICSRFAAGNVLMFNHLGTDNLYFITKRELEKHASAFTFGTGIRVDMDKKLPTALIFSAGGKTDARTVRGRAASIFHEEMFELFRLMADRGHPLSGLESISLEVALDKCPEEVVSMFVNTKTPKILLFAEEKVAEAVKDALPGVTVMSAADPDSAKEILFHHDVCLVLCDVRTGMCADAADVLNTEDLESVGQEFLSYLLSHYDLPTYLLEGRDTMTGAEFLSFAAMGVRGRLSLFADDFAATVQTYCDVAYQQQKILSLARDSKVLSYKTAQTVSEDGKSAKISFYRFRFTRAADSDDASSILDPATRPKVSFADVIGAEDAKRELSYFVDYLKDPRRYARLGLHAPKGVLLYGPPGTGKTLLAKATAGESDVTFLTTEGNRFVKQYRGEGAEAVHTLFRTARKYAPAIIFVDEIDAIGKDRAEGRNDEMIGDVLTAFLTEMDGFTKDPSKPVFVLAATNYAVEKGQGKTLDGALLRRFDRRIYVDLPNKEERLRFCRMRVSRSPAMALSDAEMESIATRSVGMSLAELESIFEMALRGAVRTADGKVGDEAFEEAYETFVSGEKRERSEKAVERTARHEAGHALLCWLSGECPAYLTVVSRADHGGYMQHADSEDKGVYTKKDLLWHIRTALAGRAAELVYYGKDDGLSTGPSGDLQSATRLARAMICDYGMDEVMGLSYTEPAAATDAYHAALRARTNEILAAELDAAVEAVEKNRAAVDALVAALVEKNQLRGTEIDAIFCKLAVR